MECSQTAQETGLGMWTEAAASNESAWEVSDAWVKRKNLPITMRDYHSLHWLLYVYLQQGRYHKAEELLTLMKQTMSESTYDNKLRPAYYETNYANMAAAFVVETERWELAAKFFPASSAEGPTFPETAAVSGHGGHNPLQSSSAGASTTMASSDGPVTVRASNRSRTLPLFIRGLAGAVAASPEAEKSLMGLKAISVDTGYAANMLEIRELEITALAATMKHDYDRAITSLKQATSLEEAMGPPSGPPGLIKPSHELYGEILLRAGKPREAAEQFRLALLNEPNRARSLLGAARAASQSGDQSGATLAYRKLLDQWQQADEGIPELREARDYLKQATR